MSKNKENAWDKEKIKNKVYSADRMAGTEGETLRGRPHSGRCRGQGSGGWDLGTWTAVY